MLRIAITNDEGEVIRSLDVRDESSDRESEDRRSSGLFRAIEHGLETQLRLTRCEDCDEWLHEDEVVEGQVGGMPYTCCPACAASRWDHGQGASPQSPKAAAQWSQELQSRKEPKSRLTRLEEKLQAMREQLIANGIDVEDLCRKLGS